MCRSAPSGRWSFGLLDDDRLATALAHALLGVFVGTVRDAGGLPAVRAEDHDLPEPERHGLLDDPALLVLRGVRLGVVLGDVDAGDDHGQVARANFLHPAALPAVLARDHHDLVAFTKAHACHLEDLRCERDDLHEVALAKLACDRPEDARPARLVLRIQKNGRVVVEADVRTIRTPVLLGLAHDDRAHDLALLHTGVRD